MGCGSARYSSLTMIRWLWLIPCALILGACAGPGDDPIDEPGVETAGGGFKVALLTPGPVSDAGWSAMAYEGLLAIEENVNAEIANREATDAQIRDAMRSYAQEGYDLVIGHGFEYNAPAVEVAGDFPETIFVSTSGSQSAENAGALRFNLEQGFYIAGYAAAKLSKSGVLGMVGGPDVPSIRSTFNAFKAGALAADPNVEVKEVFTGQNEDIAAAKEAALATIADGADILIHQANAGAQGVFDACKEKGVLAMGANLDQNDNPSGVVIGSAVIVAEPAFVQLAEEVKAGAYQGTITLMTMGDGAIDFMWKEGFDAPQELRDEIQQLRDQIVDGEVTVPKDEF